MRRREKGKGRGGRERERQREREEEGEGEGEGEREGEREKKKGRGRWRGIGSLTSPTFRDNNHLLRVAQSSFPSGVSVEGFRSFFRAACLGFRCG